MKRPIAYLFVLLLLSVGAMAQQSPTMLAKPKKGYVLDKARLLSKAAIASIDSISASSAKAKDSPIYVVTIPSLASVHGFDIVTYANELFDAWGVGSRMSNKGILLLISKADRKARIALGAGWRYVKDDECASIMNQKIVPRFKTGDYSGGALSGVQALSQMAKGGTKPTPPAPEADYNAGSSSSYYPMGGSTQTGGAFTTSSGMPAAVMLCPLLPIALVILIVIANAAGGSSRHSNYGNSGGWFSSSSGWGSHHHHHGGGIFGGGGGFGSSSSGSSSSSSSSGGGGYSGGGGASGSW